jgi:hypothetical protein
VPAPPPADDGAGDVPVSEAVAAPNVMVTVPVNWPNCGTLGVENGIVMVIAGAITRSGYR